MKRIFTSTLLLLSLGLHALAQAQQQTLPTPKVDTTLVSERTEGDFLIRQYRIEQAGSSDFTILYRINSAKLNTQLGRNAAELQALDGLFKELTSDSLKQVRHLMITGYASPDGPQALNERLSKARTQDFVDYANRHYQFAERYPLQTASVAEPWSSCEAAIHQATMPDKEAVVEILKGSEGDEQKEQRLKQLRSAWEYLAREILPEMRRVEVVVNYSQQTLVENREMIPHSEPAPVVAQPRPSDPCGECVVVDEGITGWIVAYPESHTKHHPRSGR